jgi:hypothetical protein
MKRILALLALTALHAYAGVFTLPSSVKAHLSTDAIESIREHYAEINRNLSRYRKVRKQLPGYSIEGGMLEAYADGQAVRKIVATYYGETGKAVEEFYFWDGQLIFVFRKDFQYDRPLSGKTVSTRENRFYFDNNRLIRWVGESGRQVSSSKQEYSEKQREYLESSEEFIKLARS